MPKILAFLFALSALIALPAGATESRWVAAWAAAPDQAAPAMAAQTIRQVVRPTVAGSAVRLRFSNLYGKGPLTLGPVRLARSAGRGATATGTDVAVTFRGRPTVVLSPGGEVVSDAVTFPVAAFEEIAISLYLPDGASAPTVHGVATATVWLAPGDHTRAAKLPGTTTDSSWFLLSGVHVKAAPGARALVVLGDSVSDGVGSTDDANLRWPDQLARRIAADPRLKDVAVVNAGIAGNRVLNDAVRPFVGYSSLNRLDRDVLSQPGVKWVLILQGSNDVSGAELLRSDEDQVSAEQIIAGLKRLADRAHARGLKVFGGVLLPREIRQDGLIPGSLAGEAKRQAIRHWIRSSGVFDAVIDFHAAVRDPPGGNRLKPAFDSGDHLHPNDAGYAAMAEAIDLSILY
ncbi:SGNH/GDSL hydrolase family protein [Sphingobium sp. BYY-5]|uniref:SGNH/GDSL hydrolase family protein n=1 Tax=Sphingobium sp. BYY-5 TaxID=2926400 RepID=UPI001FA7CE34|nr:SGNH/GDSL hydrolase family protein [Sphingobium sp. BYY-5]MCI4591236.1 SGNH/GDSL hydrolase family protein [Sphingobium sp. BYY-5]